MFTNVGSNGSIKYWMYQTYTSWHSGLGFTRKMSILEFLELSCTSLSLHLCVYATQIVPHWNAKGLILVQTWWKTQYKSSCRKQTHIYVDTPMCMYVYRQQGYWTESLVSTDSRTGIATFSPRLHTWVENRAQRRDMKLCGFFFTSAVCSRSGTGVKQTHLMQKNEVIHQQVWRSKLALEKETGGGNRNFWKTMICKDATYDDLFKGGVLAQPGWQESLDGQWWEKWTKGDTVGGWSIISSIFPLCCSPLEHQPQRWHICQSCRVWVVTRSSPAFMGSLTTCDSSARTTKSWDKGIHCSVTQTSELAAFHPGLLHSYPLL